MKQKIVIKTRINCKKCKTKAIQIVAKASSGVTSVGVEGDEVVIKGDEVDCTTLASKLKKKLGWAEIISVEIEKQKDAAAETPVAFPSDYHHPYSPYPQVYVCECESLSSCSIL